MYWEGVGAEWQRALRTSSETSEADSGSPQLGGAAWSAACAAAAAAPVAPMGGTGGASGQSSTPLVDSRGAFGTSCE